MLIDQCKEFLSGNFNKFSMIKRDGTVLTSTISPNVTKKMFSVLKELLNKDLLPGQTIFRKPVVFFRVTEKILLIILSNLKEEILNSIFDVFCKKFKEDLEYKFPNFQLKLGNLVKYTIFSSARNLGPEPLGWWQDLDRDLIDKYSTSSLLLLMNEIDGASQRTLNFHPFIRDKLLGIVYLFQIPLKGARGKAFDSSILLMTDYKNRSIMYSFHIQIEQILNTTANELTESFINDYGNGKLQDPITDESREKFAIILKKMNERLLKIDVNF